MGGAFCFYPISPCLNARVELDQIVVDLIDAKAEI